VTVATDLTITGKVAQFGRGVLADVSSKLIGQFVDALEADLASGGQAAAAASADDGGEVVAPDGAAGASDEAPATDSNGSGPASAQASGPRRIDSPEAEPLDLLAVAGGSTVKRLVPVLAVVAVILALLWRRRAGR
jgi:hypothetical protein